MVRLLFVVMTLLSLMVVLCGCEKTKGNTPDTKAETMAPQSSMESAYKGRGAGQPQPR